LRAAAKGAESGIIRGEHMCRLFLVGAMLAATALAPVAAEARTLRPNRIDIQYVEPKTDALKPIYDVVRKARMLEKVRDLLRPLKLPRRLLLKTEGCDGVSNAWYDGDAVTVCYEYLDDIWKAAPAQTTPAGIAPIDTLIGPVADVFLHEVGHAVFDLWKIPLLGREEDAADQFSAYIMLQFRKDEARRLIMGSAYQYKADMSASQVVMPTQKFADEHGTPTQRFYNLLCIAYGADPVLFADFASTGMLPKDRAEYCEDEYKQVAYAFRTLLRPYIDRKLARGMHRSWLAPVDRPPPRRPKTL
jgi:hypothetical protein